MARGWDKYFWRAVSTLTEAAKYLSQPRCIACLLNSLYKRQSYSFSKTKLLSGFINRLTVLSFDFIPLRFK